MKIMLADDERAMRTLIERIVLDEGYEFCVACDGLEALEVYEEERPDLLILDVMMPELDGFQVCRKLRERGVAMPIVFLSAKGDIVDKGVGFDSGGDDYIVKPFNPQELLMRIRAQLRKRDRLEADLMERVICIEDFEFDAERHKVKKRGEPIDLTGKEFQILYLLASHSGEVFTREQLTEEVWGKEFIGEVTSLAVFVRKIREKIEDDPSNPHYVQTVWRLGYRFGD